MAPENTTAFEPLYSLRGPSLRATRGHCGQTLYVISATRTSQQHEPTKESVVRKRTWLSQMTKDIAAFILLPSFVSSLRLLRDLLVLESPRWRLEAAFLASAHPSKDGSFSEVRVLHAPGARGRAVAMGHASLVMVWSQCGWARQGQLAERSHRGNLQVLRRVRVLASRIDPLCASGALSPRLL